MYALSELKHKRATIAAEIVYMKRQLAHRKEMLIHVDATLRILDPSIKVDSIPPKRAPQRIKLFRQGELGRMIVDVVRRAGGQANARDIVTAMLAVGGHGEEARPTLAIRVRGNLAYLVKMGKLIRDEHDGLAVWRLPR
jgi:hypothetical protein